MFVGTKLNLYLNFSSLFISPLHPLIWINLFLLLKFGLSNQLTLFEEGIFHFSIGVLLTTIVLYFQNSGNVFFQFINITWRESVGVLFYLLLYSIFIKAGNNKEVANYMNKYFLPCSFFFTVYLFFRISQQIMLTMNVPNEERSLILGGIEIHHFISGYILIMILMLFQRIRENKWGNLFYLLILFFGMGNVIDQITYINYLDLSDLNYFSSLSFVGPVVYILFLIIINKCYAGNSE